MTSAAEPKTDRELLIMVASEVKGLREAVQELNATFTKFEEVRVQNLDERLTKVESIIHKAEGGWRVIAIIGAVLFSVVSLGLQLYQIINK